MVGEIARKTRDPRALEWHRGYEERRRLAHELLKSFPAAFAELFGEPPGGAVRTRVAYRPWGSDVHVLGVFPAGGEEADPPAGTRVMGGALVPDLRTRKGREYQELVDRHSTRGVAAGGVEVGFADSFFVPGYSQTAGLVLDPETGELFQHADELPGTAEAIDERIAASSAKWEPAKLSELHAARERVAEQQS